MAGLFKGFARLRATAAPEQNACRAQPALTQKTLAVKTHRALARPGRRLEQLSFLRGSAQFLQQAGSLRSHGARLCRLLEPARYVLYITRRQRPASPITLIATPEDISLHAAPRAAVVQPPAARTLSEAIQAVNDHQRQVELRRMTLAAQQRAPSDDWSVPMPRTKLQALEQQARQAAALRSLLDNGPVIAVPFSALPPYTLRDMPASLSRAIGSAHDAMVRDRPLTRLFSATDLPRLQQALYDGDAVTLIAHLRRADGHALRCSVHLSAPDPADPDWRWACIVPNVVRSLQTSDAAPEHHERHLPPKSNQRPRLDAWPTPSA
jgi:hypothetical protein